MKSRPNWIYDQNRIKELKVKKTKPAFERIPTQATLFDEPEKRSCDSCSNMETKKSPGCQSKKCKISGKMAKFFAWETCGHYEPRPAIA